MLWVFEISGMNYISVTCRTLMVGTCGRVFGKCVLLKLKGIFIVSIFVSFVCVVAWCIIKLQLGYISCRYLKFKVLNYLEPPYFEFCHA